MNAHDKKYIAIWAVLLVAMVISIALGEFVGNTAVVVTIFMIAAAKAYLVVAEFMHLRYEAPWLRWVLVGAVLAMVAFVVGITPDVARHWSVIPPKAEVAQDAVVAVAKPLEPGNAERGGKVYGTYCVGCHMADGKGNNGTTAANFVDDASRLAKTDEELLVSIAEGKNGTIGAMPPWKGALSEQQRVDVLAYVRATFGAR